MAGKSVYRAGKGSYKYTARRRAALHRAQLISARKRKRNARIKTVAKVAGVGVLAAGGVGAGVYLGKGHNAKNIKTSVKSAGAFGKDLASAFRAVDPVRKETNRRQRAISRRATAAERGREAARKGGNRTVLGTVGPQERKRLQDEATRNHAPSTLDPSTFNRDGTVNQDPLLGRPVKHTLTTREVRAGIGQSSRARARSGGTGLTAKQKNEAFKVAQGVVSQGRKVTTGAKIADRLPKTPGSTFIPADPSNPRTALNRLLQQDNDFLEQYRELTDPERFGR